MPPSPLAFLSAHRAEARHTARVMAAVTVAYALYAAFELPQGYWAVFTTLIVMQASIGGTVGASVDRMYGTVLGALVGGGAAALRSFSPFGMSPLGLGVMLVAASGITAYVAMLRPNMKVAPVTAAIMLLSSTGKLGPLHAAAYRVVEIGLGSLVGVAATLLIFPARSRKVVAERTGSVLASLAELLGHYADWLERAEVEPIEALHPLHDRIRAEVGSVEQAVDDTERETGGPARLSPPVAGDAAHAVAGAQRGRRHRAGAQDALAGGAAGAAVGAGGGHAAGRRDFPGSLPRGPADGRDGGPWRAVGAARRRAGRGRRPATRTADRRLHPGDCRRHVQLRLRAGEPLRPPRRPG